MFAQKIEAMTKIRKPCHEIFFVVVCGYGWLPIDPMCKICLLNACNTNVKPPRYVKQEKEN